MSVTKFRQSGWQNELNNNVTITGFLMTPVNSNYSKFFKERRLYFVIATRKKNPTKSRNAWKFDSFLVYLSETQDKEFYENVLKSFKKDDLVHIQGHITNDLVLYNERRNEFFQPTIAHKALNLVNAKIQLKHITKIERSEDDILNEKRFRQQYYYQLKGYTVKFKQDAFKKDKFGIDTSDGLDDIIK